jgi:Spy/CpxP family protein refolding chaperone
MLRTLLIGFVAAAMLGVTSSLAAKEPEKPKPLRERVYISNAVGATIMLLDSELVQKEIALTEAQRKRIAPLRKEIRDSLEKVFRDNPETPPSKQDGSRTEIDPKKVIKNKDGSVTIQVEPADPERDKRINQASKELDQKIQKQLDRILLPGQLDRVWEIIIQTESFILSGSDGMPDLDRELIKLLEVTDVQLRDIGTICRDASTAQNAIVWAGPSFEELKRMPKSKRQEKLHKRIQDCRSIITNTNAKLLAILTPKQREQIAAMKGKEIDFIVLMEQLVAQDFDDAVETPPSDASQPAQSPAH